MACKIAVFAFSALYAVALFLFFTGTFGWFGQDIDPLSGVFLLPLGLPWVLGVDVAPEIARPWLAVMAPLINLVTLALFCQWVRSAKT